LNEIWSTLITLSGAGPGRSWARSARAGELGEILLFLTGKQRTILPISRRPNFTKFEHNTSIGEAMNPFGTEFENLPVRGRFFQKNAKNLAFFAKSSNFWPLYITPQRL